MITTLQEHHLGHPGPPDRMACTTDPWTFAPGVLPASFSDVRGLYWFEWDDFAGRDPAKPLWSVCMDPELLAGGACKGASPAAVQAAFCDVAARLKPAWGAEAVQRLMTALGESGRLLHVASLAPRGRDVLRLSTWMRAGALPGVLHALGVPPPVQLAQTLHALVAPFHHLGVQWEATADGFGPYLALESPTYFEGHRAPSMDVSRWSQVDDTWDRLVAWVAEGEPGPGPGRRQLYMKLTSTPDGWYGKAYVGVRYPPPGSAEGQTVS